MAPPWAMRLKSAPLLYPWAGYGQGGDGGGGGGTGEVRSGGEGEARSIGKGEAKGSDDPAGERPIGQGTGADTLQYSHRGASAAAVKHHGPASPSGLRQELCPPRPADGN